MPMGTLPEGAFAGTSTLTCKTPAVSPGADPAYKTWGLCTKMPPGPPKITVTDCTGLGIGTTAGLPSTPAGVVWPSPVAYNTITEPFAAGFDGVLSEKS